MKKANAFIRRFGQLLAERDLFFNASAISFNLFLFSIPFSLLVGSLIGYVMSIDVVMGELSRYAREFFPAGLYDRAGADFVDPANLFTGLIQPLVDSRRSNLFFGFLILTFTSLALFTTLKQVIYRIFDCIDKKHRFSDFMYSFLTFGIVGSIFVFFSYLVSLITLFSTNDIVIPSLGISIGVGPLFDILSSLIAIAFTLSIFYVLFRYLGERSIKRQTAFVGAAIYTTLFQSARYIFGFFLNETLRTYASVYQSYSILLILSLWTFYTAIIFVVATAGARAWQDEVLN